jgi:hypothetical protein
VGRPNGGPGSGAGRDAAACFDRSARTTAKAGVDGGAPVGAAVRVVAVSAFSRPLGRVSRLPEEVLFFARSAAYGLFIGVVYWILTAEPAGTTLLVGFGGASAVLALILAVRRRRPAAVDRSGNADGPFGDETGRIPAPTLAPLQLGFGLALAGLAIPFGVWMAIAAVVPILAGSLSWLHSAEREWTATASTGKAPDLARRSGN